MPNAYTIALCGNPNVGKSSIFNTLTGLHQHTGNWPGKTVACAQGNFSFSDTHFTLVDLPGCYSLNSSSQEEEIARDYLKSQQADAIVVVCDATCLERNLLFVLQTLSLTSRVLLCLNLMDEARHKHIQIDINVLSQQLNIPVVPVSARTGEGITELKQEILKLASEANTPDRYYLKKLNSISETGLFAADLASAVIRKKNADPHYRDRKVDAILTGKWTAFPIMLLLFALIFYITISGANIPSNLLSNLFSSLELPIYQGLLNLGLPLSLANLLVFGIYRVMTWVISVMLPPMAIFFPLFTILEDLGYLPRIAFNLDHCFCKCKACGKQALCMCMGLGCNAVGVTGCRIIDSPRERLIAILTNSFVPCNGRFPTLIMLTTLFLAGSAYSRFSTAIAALALAGLICLSVFLTLFSSRLLSATLLKGVPSAFTLELPPYRRPQVGKILIRSLIDRTLRVLWRAVMIAAPAGLLIWCMANVTLSGQSLISYCIRLLNPFAGWIGLDGTILLAFILGMPANEIVVPIIIMCYIGGGTLMEFDDLSTYHALFVTHGWTWNRVICTTLFTLVHWPCTTTLLTIRKETGSRKWTVISFLLPALTGMLLCAAVHWILILFGIY